MNELIHTILVKNFSATVQTEIILHWSSYNCNRLSDKSRSERMLRLSSFAFRWSNAWFVCDVLPSSNKSWMLYYLKISYSSPCKCELNLSNVKHTNYSGWYFTTFISWIPLKICGTASSHASSVRYAVGVQITQDLLGKLFLLKSPQNF